MKKNWVLLNGTPCNFELFQDQYLGVEDHAKNIYSSQNQFTFQSKVIRIPGIGEFFKYFLVFLLFLKRAFYGIIGFLSWESRKKYPFRSEEFQISVKTISPLHADDLLSSTSELMKFKLLT